MDNQVSSQSQKQEMLPMKIDEDCYMAILAELDEKYWKPKYLRLKKKLRKSKTRAEHVNRQRNYLHQGVGKKSH